MYSNIYYNIYIYYIIYTMIYTMIYIYTTIYTIISTIIYTIIYTVLCTTMIYPHIQANSPAGRTGIWWALERYLCLVWIPCSSMHGRVDIFANMVPIVSTPASNALSRVGWQLNWLNLTAHHGIAHPSPFTPENGLVFAGSCHHLKATLATALRHNESKWLLPSKAHRYANGLGSLDWPG